MVEIHTLIDREPYTSFSEIGSSSGGAFRREEANNARAVAANTVGCNKKSASSLVDDAQ